MNRPPTTPRNYQGIVHQAAAARSAVDRDDDDRVKRMRIVCDLVWDDFNTSGVSWVGFYLDQPGEPDDRRLVLGPCRNKPACSPIGVHGACGQALLAGTTLIVRDVKELGPNYIACDPRDRSEIVVPLFDQGGRPFAVLDVDSWELGAFDESDDAGLHAVLRASGLSAA